MKFQHSSKPWTLAVIQMRLDTLLFFTFLSLTVFSSCRGDNFKCEIVQEWKIQNYKIVKKKCPDLVLAYYFEYNLYFNDEEKGYGASQIDSCVFTCQIDNERFLTLNVCENSIKELNPNKVLLDINSIDSVTMFSIESKQTQLLYSKQIKKFCEDWNKSKTRGYFGEPFDSAFSGSAGYQYKLTVYSGGRVRPFYGYNYLVLDSSNWKFEMSRTENIKYFKNYWKK